MNFLKRNVASQTIRVFAFDRTDNTPVTGDAANITAQITLDDGTPAASNDTNPAEVDSTDEAGYYKFTLTQAESNANDFLDFVPKSATADVQVITEGGSRFLTYADGTFDAVPSTQASVDALNDISLAEVNAEVDQALADYDGPTHSELTSALAGLNDFDPVTETVNLSAPTEGQIDSIQTALFDLLLGFATFGSINDATPSATEFTVSADFVNADDHYVSTASPLRVYALSGDQKGKRATITDQVGLTLTVGTGFDAAPENGALIAIMS